jgi:DNA primase
MIDELLTAQGIEFRPSGKDYLIRCLNPEHEDRNPSLRIDKTTGIFNCLSCAFSGNIYNHFGETPDWLQIKRESFKTLLSEKLSDTSGLSIPENAVPFSQNWRNISAETYIKFGAFQHNNPEYIGRVVFPIKNITGKIVAFCGRHQGQGDPKYLFHPAKAKLPLFPIVKPIHNRIILVEGIIDMLNLHDKGLTNAVCAFGVNKITVEKLNILKIQGISGIDIYYDNDEAGQRGSEALKLLLDKQEVPSNNVIYNKDNKDPGELTALQVLKLKEELYG